MSNPSVMVYVPFALNGKKNTIQVTRQTNQDEEDATLTEGFPDVTMIKESVGGKAPKGLDFNGIFYLLSVDTVHRQSGQQIQYDATYATNIGGYKKGAILQSTDLTKSYINTVDGNLTDPDSTSASSWSRFAYTPVATSTTLGTVKIADTLTSTATDTALTANQGRVLNNQTTALTTAVGEMFSDNSMQPNGRISIKDANGNTVMVQQWGSGTGTGGDLVYFPRPFPNNLFAVIVTDDDGYASHGYKKSDSTTSYFKLMTDVPTLNFSYFAIGN